MYDARLSAHRVETVYTTVLLGTYIGIGAVTALLLINLSLGHERALGALMVCLIAVLYVVVIRLLARRGRQQAAAYLLIVFYLLIAAGIVFSWGINTPMGLLIFGMVIVLSGILLKAWHAPLAAVVAGLILVGLQTSVVFGWYTPDMSWTGKQSSYGDAIASCVVFGLLALISWLHNREMERSLSLAKHAELALFKQKTVLKRTVERRTAQLRRVQLEEMQQMYSFAELGQSGVTLLHDLANYLTALTLELDDLQSEKNTKALARTREITGYLEEIVDTARSRLLGATQKQTFNIIRKTSEVVNFLDYKATKANVVIDWRPAERSWTYFGDPTCFSQLITLIVSNAIDSYGGITAGQHPHAGAARLSITMQRSKRYITIKVSDWGKSISKSQRKHLFKPFQATNKTGLGIGLFIARQTVAINFGGTLTLSPDSERTEFIIKLPIGRSE